MRARQSYFEGLWAFRNLRNAILPGSRASDMLPLLESGAWLLDLGGGQGLSAQAAIGRFQRIVVLELASRPLPAAQALGALPIQGDFSGTSLPFSAGHFDAVICLSALQYADEPGPVLGEIFRVLRPGGQLGLIVPNMRVITRLLKLVVLGQFPRVSLDAGYDGGTRHYYCSRDLIDLMSAAGFHLRHYGGRVPRPNLARWLPERLAVLRQLKAEFFCAEIILVGEKRAS